ncbi:ATP-binding protein [Plasticicumulans acidivorans]|uniref:Sensory/regulatory protein RpfC n=1 Tax=Plasticicumulans acidivorans TaxID=886464 RepID=A0A317MR51_9GAMM|nr:ATP-binding protein [Plasticicumulans acidivorans]PWV58730.1 signal transduction histidine kinase [Plasticicumulans acidivorans]
MLDAFTRLSIRHKLMGIMLLTAGSVLFLAMVAMAVNEALTLQRTTRSQLAALADVIASSSRAALSLNDPLSALETFDALRSKSNIVYAVLTTPDGRIFAAYHRPGSGEMPDDSRFGPATEGGHRFLEASGQVHLIKPVLIEWQVVGTLHLAADFGELYASLGRYMLLLALLMLGSFIFAVLIASKLQRIISGPILRLQLAMKRVSDTRDYAVRVEADTQDELGALVGGFNDMLEQIQSRDGELARYSARLAEDVERRTHELIATNRELQSLVVELREQKERAEAASRAKSQFLANVSHEIRTPMNGMLGMTELLRHTALNERQQQLTGLIQRSGQTLLGIINDILDLSRIEAGRFELEEADFELRPQLEQTLELYREEARRRGLELSTRFAAHLPSHVRGDPGRLGQILGNLLSNALKFTPSGQIRVRVDALAGRHGHVTLGFEVSDTGIGIAAEDQARIFDAFTQTDPSSTRRHGGTGLGLTIARQLVERMGGQIGLSSAPGQGTSFWFTVQIKCVSTAAEPQAEPLRGMRVVLVGFPEARCNELHARLQRWGIIDCAADDAASAFDRLARQAGASTPCGALLAHAGLPAATLTELGERLQAFELPLLLLGDTEAAPGGRCEVLNGWPPPDAALLAALGRCRERKPTAATPPPLPAGTLRCAARVLLAEDNAINEEVARTMLRELGCTVTSVDNGRDAVDAVRDGDYDLVFMDGQMPVLDGLDATREIRAMEAKSDRARTPIVALTAHAVRGDRERYLAAGMDDYISKPFTTADLQRALARWCRRAANNPCSQRVIQTVRK